MSPGQLALIAIATVGIGITAYTQLDPLVGQAVERHVPSLKQAVEAQLTAEAKRRAELEAEVAELKKSIQEISGTVFFHRYQIADLQGNTAQISTEDRGYQIARTPHGLFVVASRSIRPHLDGFIVTVEIGNMSSARFNGAQIEVGWGLPFGTQGRSFAEINASQRKRTISVTTQFPPGAYTLVEVPLTPAKPEEVKSISVGLTFNNLSLSTPPQQR